MPALTSANISQAIPKAIATEVLEALVPVFVMGGLIDRSYDNVIQSAGDVVNVPIAPTMVANNIIESGSVQPQNPDLGNAQVVLDTHAEATFQIPDVTRAISQPDLMRVYTTSAANAIAVKLETDILNQYALWTANAAVGAATAMDESRIDAAETELFNAFVPPTEQKYLVVSGTAFGQLRQIPRFTEFQTGVNRDQQSPLQTGQLAGRVKDFIVFRSQLVPKVGGTTYNMAFSKSALSLVVRALPLPMPGTGAIGAYVQKGNFGLRVTMSYIHNILGNMVTVDCLYGVGVLRQEFGVQVLSN